ncbi:MAG TPA: hypothetical protein VLJ59_10645 [Mycobacteriales bacterium]|nr:hypothetical protein [Mycobacteriales bacterium]
MTTPGCLNPTGKDRTELLNCLAGGTALARRFSADLAVARALAESSRSRLRPRARVLPPSGLNGS